MVFDMGENVSNFTDSNTTLTIDWATLLCRQAELREAIVKSIERTNEKFEPCMVCGFLPQIDATECGYPMVVCPHIYETLVEYRKIYPFLNMPNNRTPFPLLGGIPIVVKTPNRPHGPRGGDAACIQQTQQADGLPQDVRWISDHARPRAGLTEQRRGICNFNLRRIAMAGRGMLTEDIAEKSKSLLGYKIDTTELRLMAYVQYVMVNEQKINPRKCNQDDREVLARWRKAGHMEGGASGLAITREFWDIICELIFMAYVAYET